MKADASASTWRDLRIAKTVAAGAAVALLGALFLAAPAMAWTTPVGVSPLGPVADLVGAEEGPTGDAIVGWELNGMTPSVIQGRVRAADGTLGATNTITSNAAQAPSAFAMEGSKAYFLWVGSDGVNDRVQMRTLSTAGTLGPVVTVSPPNKDAAQPAFDVDAGGDAVVAWTVGDRVIQARNVSAAGTLGPLEVVSPIDERSRQPKVAVDSTGDAVILWNRSTDGSLHAVQRQSDGTLGPVIDLAARGYPYYLVSDAAGDSVIAYKVNRDVDKYVLQTRTLSADGTLGPEQLAGAIATPSPAALAIDPTGPALLSWESRSGAIVLRTLTTSGGLGPANTLSSAGTSPDIGLDSSGNSVIGWNERPDNHQQTWARRRAAGGSLGPAQLVSGVRPGGAPLVGLNDNGDAIAAWENRGRVLISADP